MTGRSENVIAFAPRPQPVPQLEFVELRLRSEDCAIEMTVHDELGNRIVLGYTITSKPEDFDIARLREAWAGWRGCSAVGK